MAQITRIRVRETVPDSVLDRADDIEVDRPHARRPDPAAQGGQGLRPETGAARARPLFLARQPDRAARAGAAAARRSGSTSSCSPTCGPTPSPARGRRASGVLVCVSEDPRRPALVRYAQARWPTGCTRPGPRSHVETPRAAAAVARPSATGIADALRLAERLGGEAVDHSRAATIAEEIVALRRAPTTSPTSSSASPTRSRWRELLHGSVAHDLIRRAGDISVHVDRRRRAPEQLPPKTVATRARRPAASTPALRWRRRRRRRGRARRRASCCEPLLGVESVALVFLTAVLASAVALRPVAGALRLPAQRRSPTTSSSCRRSTPSPSPTPRTSSRCSSSWSSRCIVSNLAARVRARRVAARQRAKTTEELYLLQPQARRRRRARRPALGDRLPDRLDAQGAGGAAAAGGRLDRGARRLPARGHARRGRPRRREMGLARTTGRPAAAPTRCPGAKRLFLPMRTGRGAVGVVGIDSDRPGPLLTPEQRRLLDALTDQAALAIERVNLVEDVERARLRGRGRPAALGAADLDLARPAHAAGLDPRRRRQPARPTATCSTRPRARSCSRPSSEEAERLNRFIANLLDMTRLESGAVAPNRGAARTSARSSAARCERAAKILAGHQVEVELAADLPMLDARPGAVRAGAVQPARQRRQVRARRLDRHAARLARRRRGAPAGPGRGRGHPARRARAHLRQVLPGRGRATGVRAGTGLGPRRSAAASSRPWAARSRPRNRRRPLGRRVHHHPARSRRGATRLEAAA